ncbi:MAG: hypothetical protein FWG64_12805 [Firmicutes bacterium]|nr:hypothetical protein [Bacillota bacterium]
MKYFLENLGKIPILRVTFVLFLCSMLTAGILANVDTEISGISTSSMLSTGISNNATGIIIISIIITIAFIVAVYLILRAIGEGSAIRGIGKILTFLLTVPLAIIGTLLVIVLAIVFPPLGIFLIIMFLAGYMRSR